MNEKVKDDENKNGIYYKLVLKEQKIAEKDFEKFRLYLEKSELRSYYRTKDYSIFIVDGFLDNSWVFLYNHTERELGDEYFDAGNYSIKRTKNLGDNWHRITKFD